jgi:hypothetical protein
MADKGSMVRAAEYVLWGVLGDVAWGYSTTGMRVRRYIQGDTVAANTQLYLFWGVCGNDKF